MSRRHNRSAKHEPRVKQEYTLEEIPEHPYHLQTSPYCFQVVDPYSKDLLSEEMAHQYSSASYSSTSTQSSAGYYDSGPNQGYGCVQPSELTLSPTQESYPQTYYTNDSQHEYDMQPPTVLNQDSTQMARTNSNGKGEIWQCLVCTSHFTRAADLNRHYTTCHNPNGQKYDCPKNRCSRVGDNGFTRKDHLAEHLRSYHKDPNYPKRNRK